MPDSHIVLIGAGSAGVGLDTLCDLFAHRDDLAGATIGLVDVDAPALAKVERLAQRLNAASGAPFTIQASTDRRALLPGAEFVIIAVEVNRLPLWRLDWEIPRRHGVRHILGENGGPGGLLHALRTVPLVLEIARYRSALPGRTGHQFYQPLSRACLALSRYTRLNVIGLCHQIGAGLANVAQTLDLDESEIDLQAVGINHFTWITALRHRRSGADLYPAFRTRLALRPPTFEPLSRRLYDAFGLFPATGDDHLGEEIGWAWETDPLAADTAAAVEPALFRSQQGLKEMTAAALDEALHDDDALAALLDHRSDERIVPVICGVLHNRLQLELAVNVVNHGAVHNLPDWMVVETPAVVSRAGVQPLAVGDLPAGCAALLQQRSAIASLTVEAAVHGDRQAALQALLLDPVVNSYTAAAALLDDLLAAQAGYLPTFAPT
ncbi:alpha-glucosidase/alpha-galactosidase [Candidatus Amarolinea dominans]|uniref:family 4 glycosyl hydrolase n=1 Tax=Candidatus Amarolinea dominans TaxID=3140696 RepID=UPI003135C428|nr:alpha-glucosidase/alpha-galactosidase [Anaerolineae bacterium]